MDPEEFEIGDMVSVIKDGYFPVKVGTIGEIVADNGFQLFIDFSEEDVNNTPCVISSAKAKNYIRKI